MSSDPFASLEALIVSPRRAQIKAARTRAERRQQKQQEDQALLKRLWQRWHKERCAELLAGPYSNDARALLAFIERMTLEDADELIELVKQSPLRSADGDIRFLVLDLIGRTIVYLRERNGLLPFDDPLPDDEPNAFLIIKELFDRSRLAEHSMAVARSLLAVHSP